jgi:hypothetical protein
VVLALAACIASPRGDEPPADPASGPSHLIVRSEIDRGQWSNTYDLVRNLRPRWVESRGVDTFLGEPGKVQVYVDGIRLGNVELLQNVPTAAIDRLEWVDPVSAAGRWGPSHAHGVINVYYRPADVP